MSRPHEGSLVSTSVHRDLHVIWLVMQTALEKRDIRLLCATHPETSMQHIRSSPRPDADTCWYRYATVVRVAWPLMGPAQLCASGPSLRLRQRRVCVCATGPGEMPAVAVHTAETLVKSSGQASVWPQPRKASSLIGSVPCGASGGWIHGRLRMCVSWQGVQLHVLPGVPCG